MAWLTETLITDLWPVLAALAGIVGALVYGRVERGKGRADERQKQAADAAQARDATHDRLNRAPTGDDVPSDDLPDRLRAIADDFRSKRK